MELDTLRRRSIGPTRDPDPRHGPDAPRPTRSRQDPRREPWSPRPAMPWRSAQALLGSCYGSASRDRGTASTEPTKSRGRVASFLAEPRSTSSRSRPSQGTTWLRAGDRRGFGLGCSRPYVAPRVADQALVLAVDLPSGVDADTGALLGSPMPADVTMAWAR